MRRLLELVVEVEEETVERDVTEEYADTSERSERVEDLLPRDASAESSLDRLTTVGVRPVGGTS